MDLDEMKAAAKERQIGELARGELGDLIEQAVREGLRAADFKGPMVREAGTVTTAVVRALVHSAPDSAEAVAEAIDRDGGFMRVGSDSALINGRFVRAGTLVDALMRLHRREHA